MNDKLRVLIVEDTVSLALTYAGQLEKAGCTAEIAGSGEEARQYFFADPHASFDVILLDLNLPDGDGLELLQNTPEFTANTSVVVITADGSINRAIQAMRSGAYDFLVKPVSPERLTTTVQRAGERRILEREVQVARKLKKRGKFEGFIGSSDAMQVVYRAIENVASSRATVFVTGESGTGKEVTAEAIHLTSDRRNGRFVAINCGAIPENLLESELFGHVKGAFTGALENRTGAAREADGGTLFLDEICEMELKLQVKLLRFLQTGTIQRVGSSRPEAVDVRVICATNRDPAKEVQEGRFREDLFYRLSVLPIELPPLRERGDDVIMLAEEFLDRFAEEEGKSFAPLNAVTVTQLRGHSWPGNVRELQNTIRRAVVMSAGPELSLPLPGGREKVASKPSMQGTGGAGTTSSSLEASTDISTVAWSGISHGSSMLTSQQACEEFIDGMTLAEIERWVVERAISRNGGSVPGAARSLEVSPSTLYRKLERWSS
ncbi:sigma-54-dependent transcriptional regulator [Modicisalibacter radicis]|uniref:sigma-54-dependent transcriptional regulator n=1 Tax=Halomonas sp. EAR18 TaxID=2518972 RepID=UPI001B3464EF|nr:sigma-54 dependent transcriptional regulator [Halomonas sp. EAR18]